jgi:hypothetical protein
MTTPPANPSSPSSPSSSEPPLSQIPPPTMAQPPRTQKTPSDALYPLTLTGAAARHSATGCILLTTSGGQFDLVGPLAASALDHPRVKVVAMPHPEISSPCDVVTMEVQSVAVVS